MASNAARILPLSSVHSTAQNIESSSLSPTLSEFEQKHRASLICRMDTNGLSLSFAQGEPLLDGEVFTQGITKLGKKLGMDYLKYDAFTKEPSLSRQKMNLLFSGLLQRGWTNKDFTAVINRMMKHCRDPHWKVEDLFRFADTETVPRVYPVPDYYNHPYHPLYEVIRMDYTASYRRVGCYMAFGVYVVAYKSQVGDSLPEWTNEYDEPETEESNYAEIMRCVQKCSTRDENIENENRILHLQMVIQDQRILQVEMLQRVVQEIALQKFDNKVFQNLDTYTVCQKLDSYRTGL